MTKLLRLPKPRRASQVGDPHAGDTVIGPVVSETQFNKFRGLLKKPLMKAPSLLPANLPGKPDGLNAGYYVKPTILPMSRNLTIAREEVFGPFFQS